MHRSQKGSNPNTIQFNSIQYNSIQQLQKKMLRNIAWTNSFRLNWKSVDELHKRLTYFQTLAVLRLKECRQSDCIALRFVIVLRSFLIYIKKTNLMQSGSMFIGNCKISLHVSVAFCVHLQEH